MKHKISWSNIETTNCKTNTTGIAESFRVSLIIIVIIQETKALKSRELNPYGNVGHTNTAKKKA